MAAQDGGLYPPQVEGIPERVEGAAGGRVSGLRSGGGDAQRPSLRGTHHCRRVPEAAGECGAAQGGLSLPAPFQHHLQTETEPRRPEGHPGRYGSRPDRHDHPGLRPHSGRGPQGQRPEVRGRLLCQRPAGPADGASPGAAQTQGAGAACGGPLPGPCGVGGAAAKIAGAGKHFGGAFGGNFIRKIRLKCRFSKAAVFLSRRDKNFPACFADIQPNIRDMFKRTEKCHSGYSKTNSRYKPEKTGL